MSSNSVAHVSSVDKGLKMKIKRTKVLNKLDSKHEVVKQDSLYKQGSSLTGQSAAGAASVSASAACSAAASVTPTASSSAVPVNSAPFTLITALSSSSAPTTSSSSSPCSAAVTPQLSVAAPNPKVALLKAVSPGLGSECHSGSTITPVTGRSPMKAAPTGLTSHDSKDGRSPKTKAAYSKKVKDNKGKPDAPPCGGGPPLAATGVNFVDIEPRATIGLVGGNQTLSGAQSHAPTTAPPVTTEPRPGDTVHVKRENLVNDPYEFNAKVEDKIELPPKKLKLEKVDCIETAISPQPQIHQHSSSPAMLFPPPEHHYHQQQQQTQKRSVGVDVRSMGVLTEPDCLGPCEPGTLVGLEGIVWKETDNGLLVVNVTWRGKTYVGTLMDATRYAWAPPRPTGCESPVSDFDSRTPKGRGKRNCRSSAQPSERLQEGRRLRKGRRGTVNSSSTFTAPPSPAKSDNSTSNMKRKVKPSDLDNDSQNHKRSRSCSRGVESPTPDGYIVCPEPNCHKKYKHMNGLRYHRTHAHRKSSLTDEGRDDEEEEDEEEDKPEKKEKTNLSERAERMKAKEKQRIKEQQRSSDKDSLDDIPLKEIVNKSSEQVTTHKVGEVKDRIEGVPCSSSAEPNVSYTVVCSKTDPQIVLTKTSVPPPASVVGANKKESPVVDASVSIASTVPFTSTASESPPPADVNSSSTSHPSANGARSQTGTANPSPTAPQANQAPSSHTSSAVVTAHSTSLAAPATGAGSLITAATTLASVPAPSSLLGGALTSERQNISKSTPFTKTSTSIHPIVPASPYHTGNAHSQVITSQPSGQPHCSPLQPIQPKPTIMGDYSVISAALSDLSREKQNKAKRKKDIPGTVNLDPASSSSKNQVSARDSSNILSDTVSRDGQYKGERSAVIKGSNPSKTSDSSSTISDMCKIPFQPSVSSARMQPADSLVTGGSRVAIPPSSLSISSIIDSRSTASDDVHSPAYSDISDANDSNSPVQHDSPKKESSQKKEGRVNGAPHFVSDGSTLPQHYGNVFYFGGPHSFMRHGLTSQMASPTMSEGLKKEDQEETRSPSCSEKMSVKKEGGAHSLQEAELQRKSLINYYAHLHGVSPAAIQLQFNLAGYSSPVLDTPYAMLAHQVTDQSKQQHEPAILIKDGPGKQAASGVPSTTLHVSSECDTSGKVNSGTSQLDEPPEPKRLSDGPDSLHRDPHAPDPIDQKPQLGLHQDQHSYRFAAQHHPQQNDLLRAQVFQKQKLEQRQDKRKGPLPQLTSTRHQPSPSSRYTPDSKPQERTSHDLIKKEITQTKDSCRLDSQEAKRSDINENTHPNSAGSSLEMTSKSRPPSGSDPANIPLVNSSSSSSPSTAAIPVPLVTSLPQPGAAFPYGAYYPHYRPVPLDPVYRAPHILGYGGAPPGYIHPAQLGYRLPITDPDQKPPDPVDAIRGELPGLVGYAHKIHELQEKAPGVHAPAPKSVNTDSSSSCSTPGLPAEKVKDKQREYSSSPPTQRHVHTHHHTHVMSGFPPLYPPDAFSKLI